MLILDLLNKNAYCTKEVKESFAIEKVAFSKKGTMLTGKLDLQLKK